MPANQEQLQKTHTELKKIYQELKQSVERYDLAVYGCIPNQPAPYGCGDNCRDDTDKHPSSMLLKKIEEYLEILE